ncbi:MAG: hypothetical protein LBH59_06320 [Planctomycetaceae bacterium]|jgi:hypothetical protein|nr:hypothetical protein [Planctomycetaceae bacterium]
MLKRAFIFLVFIFCVSGVFLFFYFPQVFESLFLRVTMPVADVVVSDNLLRDGGEYWEVISDNGKQIGFQRTNIRNNYSEQQTRLILLRRGERFDISTASISESDIDGFFVSGKSIMKTGIKPIETNYLVQDDKLIITSGETKNSVVWSKVAGADAVIRSLLKKPMQIDEERVITYFDLGQSQVVETRLIAKGFDIFDRVGGVRLLSVFVCSKVAGRVILEGNYGIDRGGNIICTEVIVGGRTLTTLRTSQRRATAILSTNDPVEYGDISEVELLGEPIILPRELSNVTFMVRVKNPRDNSPAILDMFVNSPFQKVVAGDRFNAIITVWGSIGDDPKKYGNEEFEFGNNVTNNTNDTNDELWLDEYLSGGGLVDLDDVELQRLSDSVDSGKLTEWQIAVAMEGLVFQRVRFGSLKFGFASSSDVLRSGVGGCTERAVLLTALCRKKGIPARVVLGLVYSDQQGEDKTQFAKMNFHLWNEVYVGGVWRPLDATFGLGGVDAARIKISDDSLRNDSIAQICRSILITIGQLQITPKPVRQ